MTEPRKLSLWKIMELADRAAEVYVNGRGKQQTSHFGEFIDTEFPEYGHMTREESDAFWSVFDRRSKHYGFLYDMKEALS